MALSMAEADQRFRSSSLSLRREARREEGGHDEEPEEEVEEEERADDGRKAEEEEEEEEPAAVAGVATGAAAPAGALPPFAFHAARICFQRSCVCHRVEGVGVRGQG